MGLVLKKFINIDACLIVVGLIGLIIFNRSQDMGWSWMIGSVLAYVIACYVVPSREDEQGEVPAATWVRLKNDTTSESPFSDMPPAEPLTAFDGRITYITQAGYDQMFELLEKGWSCEQQMIGEKTAKKTGEERDAA